MTKSKTTRKGKGKTAQAVKATPAAPVAPAPVQTARQVTYKTQYHASVGKSRVAVVGIDVARAEPTNYVFQLNPKLVATGDKGAHYNCKTGMARDRMQAVLDSPGMGKDGRITVYDKKVAGERPDDTKYGMGHHNHNTPQGKLGGYIYRLDHATKAETVAANKRRDKRQSPSA